MKMFVLQECLLCVPSWFASVPRPYLSSLLTVRSWYVFASVPSPLVLAIRRLLPLKLSSIVMEGRTTAYNIYDNLAIV